MQHIRSYGSVYQLGHRAIRDIFETEVTVEEKVDGSQISFGIIEGELSVRSKGKDLVLDAPEKMFIKAIEVIKTLPLKENWIYRGEYLQSPKHNTLSYFRTPKNFIILFDVETGEQSFLTAEEKKAEAERIGLECIPVIFSGQLDGPATFADILNSESILGGCKIEGVVVKNYSKFTAEKKFYLGKYVSEAFKEIHEGEWRKANPTRGDIIDELVGRYKVDARWAKAVQHIRDSGQLTESMKDIGNIIKEIPADVKKECEDEIKDILFRHFWPHISRRIVQGVPEWYKQKLLELSLGGKE